MEARPNDTRVAQRSSFGGGNIFSPNSAVDVNRLIGAFYDSPTEPLDLLYSDADIAMLDWIVAHVREPWPRRGSSERRSNRPGSAACATSIH